MAIHLKSTKNWSVIYEELPSHHPTMSVGGAAPYRGSPFPLALPLPFLYIHHTYQPDRPCRSFRQCSRNMRAMHFVVGSDGYIYEERGWHHLGTNTRGQNSYGYSVAFIGNNSSSLPSRHALDLVRQHLAKCSVDNRRLQANFTPHWHRQLVDTSCPGDALYSEIRGWEHFGVRDCSVL
uniref:Peptidoglycan recognition protein family domain-containing protein n=1 Tax=Hucho hucho TaxID=62062 RepID=A0A4W5QPP7_9TELE